MKVKVQYCWCGGDKFIWRALIAGGLRIPADGNGLRIPADGNEWSRKAASEMLDLIEKEVGLNRRDIRFDVL